MEKIKNIFKQFTKEDLKDKEMNDEKIQNERFKRMIATNIFILLLVSVFFYNYIYPNFEIIDSNIQSAQATFDYNKKIRED